MISKVTQSNKELINARIAEINEALREKGESIRINSFESYYANIIKIAELATDFHNAPYKFFLMPVDEPIFEIDANQRTIAVPSHFSKNGVGVYGDHMAEVLYFSIDRYFDYQDLFSVDEIIINWQFRANGSSRNAQAGELKTSLALAPDDTFIPGKVVFGWVITNEMTPSRGTLTFSVSFVKHIGDQYEYVLNTRTASVAIQDSLVLEDPSILDTLTRPVFNRLTNSRYTPNNVAPLVDPEFRSEPILDDRGNVIGYRGLPEFANFDIDENGIEAKSLVLKTLGRSLDDGKLVYSWSGTTYAGADDIAGNNDTLPMGYNRRDDGSITVVEDYILADTTAPESGIVYFLRDGDSYEELSADEAIEAFAGDNRANIYMRGSSLILQKAFDEENNLVSIPKAGQYAVSLQTTKEIDQEDSSKIVQNSGNTEPALCKVPFAAVPKVELTAQGIPSVDTNGTVNYIVADADTVAEYVFVEDNSQPEINAVVTVDTDKIDNEKGIFEESSLGAISFVMAQKDAEAPSEFSELSFEIPTENHTYAIASGARTEGEYCVYAVNRRNHTYSVSDASNVLKISAIAPYLEQINVAVEYGNNLINFISDNEKVEEANLQMLESIGYDFIVRVSHEELPNNVDCKLEVVEVKINNDGSISYRADLEETSSKDEPNIYVVDADGVCLVEDDPGSFIIRATTTYNGTQRVTETAPFTITADR